MVMYNLIEYSNNYAKISGEYGNIAEADATATNSESFKAGSTPADGNAKDVRE